ncbi:MAG TPA: hypothetical protein VIT62_03115 [Lysobacter sp.]
MRWIEKGNTYIICNGAACGYYRVTDSGDFHGDKVVKQEFTNPPATGGGGGGAGGVSRGSGGGSGCVGSCGSGPGNAGGGTVIIGDDEKLPPKKPR